MSSPHFEKYYISDVPFSKAYALVSEWKNGEYMLDAIFVDEEYEGQGFAIKMITDAMKKHDKLIFKNSNYNFWKHLSLRNDLPFIIKLDEEKYFGVIYARKE